MSHCRAFRRLPAAGLEGAAILLALILAMPPAALRAEPAPTHARLQVFNRSDEPVEASATGADAPARVEPGADTVMTVPIGTTLVVAGATTGHVARVTARLPVQAYVYLPDGDRAGPAAESDARGRVIAPPPSLKVDPFHAKYTSAGGFPIVSSARVSDHALLEAAAIVDAMLAARPDVRRALVDSGARLCIIGHDEFTTDLPEFAFLAAGAPEGFPGISGRDYWDARARGTGGSETDPHCSCGEENLLGYEGDPYSEECILIHEFAHAIHLRGLTNVDPSFDGRLRAAYDAALRDGLWKGKYASVNHHEYFAEGVQSWFDDNRVDDHDHNHVHLRHQLVAYDPRLAALCREVFGDTELRYTKPVTRLSGHLAGYDPAKAPRFAWPERLERARREIRRQAEARSRGADPAASPPSPRNDDDDAPR